MKADEGNGFEFYLQCTDYLFLKLKGKGKVSKGQVSKQNERSNHFELKVLFFFSHVGLFLSDFKDISLPVQCLY